MTKGKLFGIVLSGLGAFMVTTAVPTSASACGGEWYPEVQIDHRPMGVARAEKALEQGKHDEAAAMIVRMMPHVGSLDAKKATIVARAQRVLAVAIARSGGSLDIEKTVPSYARGEWAGKTDKAKQHNQDFSIAALRKLNEIKKDDPAAQTELAEALARVEKHQGEARQMLEKLAKKDLIASPEGYAVLAQLREKAGDAKGKKLALSRCQAMAPEARVCRAQAES